MLQFRLRSVGATQEQANREVRTGSMPSLYVFVLPGSYGSSVVPCSSLLRSKQADSGVSTRGLLAVGRDGTWADKEEPEAVSRAIEKTEDMDKPAVEERALTLMFPSLIAWFGVRAHGKMAWWKLPNYLTALRVVHGSFISIGSTLRKQQGQVARRICGRSADILFILFDWV